MIAVDRDPRAPGFRYADRRAIVSVEDEPALERLAEAGHVDGVIGSGDLPVAVAARIAARLGLPHPVSPETGLLSSSRLRRRERFARADVPQTRWKLVAAPDDELDVPCTVTPADRQGRRLLSLVSRHDELAPAVQAALRESRSGLCLIEEAVAMPEVTVTAFSLRGVFRALTVVDRLPSACVWPSRSENASIAVAELAARAAALEEGPSTTRVRPGPNGMQVVAWAARLGDTHEPELTEAALGIDLNGLALAAALGEEIDPARLEAPKRAGGACVRFLDRPTYEHYELDGIAEAENVEGVEWVRIYAAAEQAGAVLATGASAAQALERATRAAECIRFRTADAEALA